MFRTWKLATNTVAQRLVALRFLYIQVLKRGRSAAKPPYAKKVLHLPDNAYQFNWSIQHHLIGVISF